MSDNAASNLKKLDNKITPTISKEVPLYEKGTFTPIFEGSSGGATWTYAVQTGFYTRIGNRCLFHLSVFTTARAGVPLSNAIVTGLPFASSAVGNSECPCVIDTINNITLSAGIVQLTARVRVGFAWIDLIENIGTAPCVASFLAAGAITASAGIRLSGQYMIST